MFKSDTLNFILFFLPVIFIGFFIVRNKFIGSTFIVLGYIIGIVDYLSCKILNTHIDLFTLLRVDVDMLLMAPTVIGKQFWKLMFFSVVVIYIIYIRIRINNIDVCINLYKSINKKVLRCLKLIGTIVSVLLIVFSSAGIALKNIILEIEDYNTYATLSEDKLLYKLGAKEVYKKKDFVKAEEGKNVVIIYCESLENGYFNQKIFPNILPNLKRMREKDFTLYNNYSDVFGAGWTLGALYATQTGFPCLFSPELRRNGRGQNKVFKLSNKLNVTSIASVLQKAGYNNLFMSSANLEFAETGKLMEMLGYKTKGIEEFEVEVINTSWGVHDYDLFEQAKIEYKRMVEKDEPFNLTLLTVDTHFTNGLPDERLQTFVKIPYDKKVSMEYCLASLDYLIDDFEKFVKSQPNAENTVLVIIGDHPVMGSASQTPVVGRLEKELRRITLMSNGYPTQYSIDDKIGYYDIPDFILETAGVKYNAKFPNKVFDGDFESLVKNNASLFTHLNLKLNQ